MIRRIESFLIPGPPNIGNALLTVWLGSVFGLLIRGIVDLVYGPSTPIPILPLLPLALVLTLVPYRLAYFLDLFPSRILP